MFPYQWTWSPQVHFPFSGNVSQDISPDTNWFFGSIKADAGNGDTERKIFETASYGKQLGLILDVLMPLIGENGAEEEEIARQKLKALYERIQLIKEKRTDSLENSAIDLLERLRQSDPEILKRVLNRFQDT